MPFRRQAIFAAAMLIFAALSMASASATLRCRHAFDIFADAAI
jgi:hypothetical protein